jgi:hypothetical protein
MTATGWGLLTRRRMPGLGRRWLSLVETPDLDLVPQRFAPKRDGFFRAGLELSVLHLGLWSLSRLVALRILPNVRFVAPLARRMADWFLSFGTDRGGMAVVAKGFDASGEGTTATWAVVAEGGDGPNIPVLPAAAVIRALAEGRIVQIGAMPCVGLVTRDDIVREFSRFRIVTRTKREPRALYRRTLRDDFAKLPQAIREGHQVDDVLVMSGRCAVEGGSNMLARLIARIVGFPAAADDVPVTVEMRTEGEDEVWTRTIGGRTFHSHLAPVAGRRHIVTERFGPLTFDLHLVATHDGLDLIAGRGRIGPIPLPRFLVPLSDARERVDAQGRFTFDVPIGLPGIGRLVHYRGWLAPNRGAAATLP